MTRALFATMVVLCSAFVIGTTQPGMAVPADHRAVTITGCLTEAADQPRFFALVGTRLVTVPAGRDEDEVVGTAGTLGVYRLATADGVDLGPHRGHKVEVAGELDSRAKPIEMNITSGPEDPGAIRFSAVALGSAPRLRVTSIRHLSNDCAAETERHRAVGTTGRSRMHDDDDLHVEVKPDEVQIDAIVSDPTRLQGRLLKVEGDIGKVFGKRAFTLDADGDQDVLVLIRSKPFRKLDNDDEVIVVGNLRTLVKGEVDDLDIDDLDDDVIERFQMKPVIIAKTVTRKD